MNIRRYWFNLRRGMPVTFHLQHEYQVRWHGIYGLSIGNWFIGAVRSSDFAQPPTALLDPPSERRRP